MNGLTRETGFDITVASEVMAIFCLADIADLKRRLGNIVIGKDNSGRDVLASELVAEGSMTALLRMPSCLTWCKR